MKPDNKIAILGGTFDPIHYGHLKIAELVIEKLGFDKILFIPNKIPPHRKQPLADSSHRLNMIKLATAENSQFEINTCELDREGPSYMIDTLEQLNKELNTKLWLILGQDAFDKLPTWHKFEKLIKACNFIVLNREQTQSQNNNTNPNIPSNWTKNYNLNIVYLEIPPINISATQIRNLLKSHQASTDSFKNLLPEQVLNYIKDNNLYY